MQRSGKRDGRSEPVGSLALPVCRRRAFTCSGEGRRGRWRVTYSNDSKRGTRRPLRWLASCAWGEVGSTLSRELLTPATK